MRPSQLLAAVLAVSSVSASWPDVFENVKAIADVHGMLYGRQEDNSESSKPTATGDAAESTGDSKPTTTATGDEEPSETAKSTAKGTAKETEKASGTGKQTKTTGKATGKATNTKSGSKSKSTEYDSRLPAGGVQMVTPAAIAGPQFYKIGDWVSFAWNYTSLSQTPSAIDILATCTANQATYTLAVNQSTEETGMVYWDTGKYQADATVPLLTETYTLMIYDSDLSVSATARPGYLGVYNQFTFGMYTPQPYTPWADYNCATCNAAISSFERLTLKALFITGSTTLASLIFFACSFGVL